MFPPPNKVCAMLSGLANQENGPIPLQAFFEDVQKLGRNITINLQSPKTAGDQGVRNKNFNKKTHLKKIQLYSSQVFSLKSGFLHFHAIF
jgi:hypothetical protein